MIDPNSIASLRSIVKTIRRDGPYTWRTIMPRVATLCKLKSLVGVSAKRKTWIIRTRKGSSTLIRDLLTTHPSDMDSSSLFHLRTLSLRDPTLSGSSMTLPLVLRKWLRAASSTIRGVDPILSNFLKSAILLGRTSPIKSSTTIASCIHRLTSTCHRVKCLIDRTVAQL